MTNARGAAVRSSWWRRAAVVLVGALALAAVPVADDVQPAGAGGSRAVVNINGSVHVISFGGSVTGLQALRMVAGVTTVGFGGIGEAVCSINGVGNPATPNECLVGPNGEYWAYYRAGPGATGWQYSSRGAGATSVTDGSVEGWRYGTGGPPGFVSFCAAAGCGPPPTAAPPPPPPPPPAAATDAGSTATSTTAAKDGKKSTKGDSKDGKGSKEEQANGDGSGARSGDEGDGVDVQGEQVAADRRLDGSDDSGSPVGVIVAVLVALGVVGGGLWYRRRRIKMGA